MQEVRRSALQRPRDQVAAAVRASWRHRGLGRGFALYRTDTRRSLIGGPVSGGRPHYLIDGAA